MTAKRLMSEFPPARDKVVTLANWLKQPFSDWSFHNVRRLLPTANIAASRTPSALESSLANVGHVAFEGFGGKQTTLDGLLRETRAKGLIVMRRGRIATEWYALEKVFGNVLQIVQGNALAFEYAALAVHIFENTMLNGETIRLDGAIRMQPR